MIVISPKKITFFLLVILLLLTLLHGIEIKTQVTSLFNFGLAISVPAWYSSFNLLISSMLLALISLSNNKQVNRYFYHWIGLSLIFLYLSIDELIEIHERWDEFLHLPELSGIFYYEWVLVGIPITIIIFIAYVNFLNYLPKRTRYLFIIAGIVFISGALGIEMMAAFRDSVKGTDEIYILLTTVEEFCEILGIIIFIYALLNYISMHLQGLKIIIGEQTIFLK